MPTFDELVRLADEARTRIQEVPPAEAERLIAAGAVLIDVREEREFRAGHIPGAIHLGRGSLGGAIGRKVPDQATPILCYCAVGHRSAIAADVLRDLGYSNVASLAGGMKAYLAAVRERKIA